MTMIPRAAAAAMLAVLLTAIPSVLAADPAPASFKVLGTLQIHGDGGWDYVKLNEDGKILYVPRVTHTMIIDTGSGKTLADIAGTQRSHGVALVPALNRGFVTDGDGKAVQIFDLKTHAVLGKVAAAIDADGIVFDPASNKVLVACGDAAALVPISADVDPVSGKADPSVDLGGKPEYLAVDGTGRAYVNIQDKGEVAVVDTKTMKVVARWTTGAASRPTGLAIDPEKGRLYIGCRDRKMRVMSVKDGTVLAELPIGTGVDATAYSNGLGFASCADGTLAIIGETTPGKFEVVQQLKTAPGARTMALDPATMRIYLATADTVPATQPNGRPTNVPGSFKILVVGVPEHP